VIQQALAKVEEVKGLHAPTTNERAVGAGLPRMSAMRGKRTLEAQRPCCRCNDILGAST
jgi:hypothetical protein